LEETDAKIQAFLKDDFNTHAAMSALFDLISNITIGLSQVRLFHNLTILKIQGPAT
jgi:cysteinyl-tRNA synthetase